MLADMKPMARRNEQLTAKAYANSGYKRGDFLSLPSGLGQLEGFTYFFRGKDGPRSCMTVLLKKKPVVYSLSCICREEKAQEGFKIFREALRTLKE